jgi:hypothetical protein
MYLSEDEQALLDKMGIDVKKLIDGEQHRSSANKPKPVTLSRNNISSKVTYRCIGCKTSHTVYYDSVKRVDCEGYALNRVDTPSYEIRGTQMYDVYDCPVCETRAALDIMSQGDLISIINNLKDELRKGIQR